MYTRKYPRYPKILEPTRFPTKPTCWALPMRKKKHSMHSTDSKVGQITGIMSFPFSHKLFYFDHFVFFFEYDLQSTLCVGSELLSQRQLPGTFLSLPISSYKSPQCSLLLFVLVIVFVFLCLLLDLPPNFPSDADFYLYTF